MRVPLYIIYLFSLVAFNIISLTLLFVSLIAMYLRVFLLEFILPETLDSRIWLTISFHTLGKCSAIISSNVFSAPISFSCSSGIPIMQMLVHLIFSQRSFRLFSFLFIIFFFYFQLCGSNFHDSVFQVSYSFFCLSYSAIDSF